ncbi:MAG: ATP-binding protein [Haloplanus sp.]
MTESGSRGEGLSEDGTGEESEDDQYVSDLERYRRRLDGAMFAGDVAWWEMDVETGTVEFHENKADMLGASPTEFDHYEDFTERLHPDDYERAMDAMRDHLEGRAKKYDVEYRIRTASGEYRWFHDAGGVTEWTDDGDPEKVTGIAMDITRRKEAERELRRRNEQLSLLNRIVHHDIRNDMSVILGWVDVLSEAATEEERANLDRIRDAGEHAMGLTKDVRTLVELFGSESAGADLQSVNLRTVLETEIERVRETFADVEIRTDGDLPDVAVEANTMLSSVVGNLLTNAVEHNDKAVARIDVGAEAGPETVVVRVADNGPGIPSEDRERMFELDAKGTDSDGTGVGLYLVATLVDAYGGTVDVADNEPTGAVFTVELPRASGD